MRRARFAAARCARLSSASKEYEADCPDAGSFSISGTLVESGTEPGDYESGPLEVSLDYTLSFHGCTVDNIAIDGTMSYALEIEFDSASGQYAYYFGMSGEITFSGEVEGSCEIDASASASSDDPNSVQYEGTICGYAADEVQ